MAWPCPGGADERHPSPAVPRRQPTGGPWPGRAVPLPARRPCHHARLTPQGWCKVRDTAPGHVANVRRRVIDALTPEQVTQLTAITDAILQNWTPTAR